MKPSLVSFASLALLVFAGWQAANALSRTPAFNASLRTEGAGGNQVLGYAPAMYDRALYYRWIANGWSAFGSKARVSGDEAGVAEGLSRLRETATESLKHVPGDPTAWTLLAEAEARLGRAEAALEALEISRQLTPQIPAQAMKRVGLLSILMDDPEARDLVLSSLEPEKIDADFRVLVTRRDFGPVRRLLWEKLVAEGLALQPYPEG